MFLFMFKEMLLTSVSDAESNQSYVSERYNLTSLARNTLSLVYETTGAESETIFFAFILVLNFTKSHASAVIEKESIIQYAALSVLTGSVARMVIDGWQLSFFLSKTCIDNALS